MWIDCGRDLYWNCEVRVASCETLVASPRRPVLDKEAMRSHWELKGADNVSKCSMWRDGTCTFGHLYEHHCHCHPSSYTRNVLLLVLILSSGILFFDSQLFVDHVKTSGNAASNLR